MTVAEELEKIAADNPEGLLVPEEVVAFAENPKTVLHGEFQWDDSAAAHAYRIWQARKIISLQVTVLERGTKSIEVRAYVSLPRERSGQGGYRSTLDVLAEPEHREELLAQAHKDMAFFRRKYNVLKELAPVFAAIEKVSRAG